MKKIASLTAILAVLSLGCDSNNVNNGGGGGGGGAEGSAALSLQLEELSAGENYVSADGVLLDFSVFAMAFSKVSMGAESVEEAFTADFFDEEVTEVIEVDSVPAGDYEDIELQLGTASGLSGSAALVVRSKEAAVGPEVTESLNGKSVLIVGQGVKGGSTCDFRIELVSDGVIDVHGHDGAHVEVKAGEEAEILAVVNPNALFNGVILGTLCTDGANVTISSSSNPSFANAILDNLLNNDAVELGSTEGHSHAH